MARDIVIHLTDDEERLFNDMVLDIDKWFTEGPYKLKCENHRERIKQFMIERLIKNKASVIPSSREELIELYFKDPEYVNRKQRDERERLNVYIRD